MRGINKHSKMKSDKHFETVPGCFEKEKGRHKVEHKNTRQVPCQFGEGVRQRAWLDSSRQILSYGKKRLLKTRERGEKKQVYL